jgi:hypothetical protein
MTIGRRITTNPGVWGLALGGLAALIAMPLRLVTIEGANGSVAIWGLRTATGASLILAAILVMLCSGGVSLSHGGGRIWWALLGALFALLILVFGIVCLVNPEQGATWLAYGEAFETATGTGAGTDVAGAYRDAFDAGTLTASANLGAVLAAIGGAVALVGAAISLFRAPTRVERDL